MSTNTRVLPGADAHFFMAILDPGPLLSDLDGLFITVVQICLHKARKHLTGP